MEAKTDQKPKQMIAPIVGRKVVLFQMEPRDLPAFIRIHQADKRGYLQRWSLSQMTEEEGRQYIGFAVSTQQLAPFTVMTKEGRGARLAGFVYLIEPGPHAASIGGAMDKEFARGLTKALRRDKYTYSEDAVRTLVAWCFRTVPTMDRIATDVAAPNRASLALMERAGFRREGRLRHYLRIDDRAEDVVKMSMLREDWERQKQNEFIKERQPDRQHTKVRAAASAAL